MKILSLTAGLLTFASTLAAASFLDRLGLGRGAATEAAVTKVTGLSAEEMANGLRAALGQGVQHAVKTLSATNGFLQDMSVKIPMPEELRRVEKTLRRLKQDALADEFVTSMNRAAEQAVPEAAEVLGDSLKLMTLADAEAILTGTNNAATAYFRRTSELNLIGRFRPIVEQATAKTGVTAAYKQMLGKAPALTTFFGGGDLADIDGYVTRKALDGLFVKIADEEKRIRENPIARTTDVLKKVFGAVTKP
jgi:hypothetical protein